MTHAGARILVFFGCAVFLLIAHIVHAAIGKVSFTGTQIYDNAKELLSAILKLKPQALKGTYMKGVAICSTMSPGITVDVKSVE